MAAPEHSDQSPCPQSLHDIAALMDRAWTRAMESQVPETVGRDGFPIYADDPLASAHLKLDEYLDQVANSRSFRVKARDHPVGVSILASPEEEMLAAFRGIVVRVLFYRRKEGRVSGTGAPASLLSDLRVFNMLAAMARAVGGKPATQSVNPAEFSSLAGELLRKGLPFTEADLISCLGITSRQRADSYGFQYLSNEAVLRAVELHVERAGLGRELRTRLDLWRQSLKSSREFFSAGRKLVARINMVLDPRATDSIEPGDAWSNVALEDVRGMAAGPQEKWARLLRHCELASTSKPTKKWLKTANECLEAIGRDEFRKYALRWFELVALPRPVHREPASDYLPDPDQLIDDTNSVLLKGLAWICGGFEDKNVVRALSTLAQVCFKKVRNIGARCPRVGRACLYSLSVISLPEAAAELTRLDQVVKQPSNRKVIGQSLDRAAESSGLTREELEENSVPTYGLDADGRLRQTVGNFTAEYSVTGPDSFQLLWRKTDGKPQKSVPAEVKEQHADELKALKRTARDIEKMLPAQGRRVERLFLAEREWGFSRWRERYLDHPLMATISRRLIWQFHEGNRQAAGIWQGGRVVDNENRPLDWLSPSTRVRLWHPLGREVAEVARWRQWLEEHRVSQPFKQAHREIYILTDAELQTGTYSNRFAAHIIRQHQFAALAQDRGWKYHLQGGFDSHNVPTIVLPRWGLSVEFWVESLGMNEGMSGAGIFLSVATDQVRFCDGGGLPRLLSEVPALVFSEMMRDVDLFVGVCSIGNDPTWQNRTDAHAHAHVDYWRQYAFGDLSATAKTRREVLEKLLPRLKIAGKCELQDKFLAVKGTIRTYKIHLGSSNILMSPNDQYLCIVPDRSLRMQSMEGMFLPFEGDSTLAVILSKAFLLADDAKIKDPSITRQIGGK
jgi:hypothetical protein